MKACRKVKVWRPAHSIERGTPVFKGDWFLGDDWKKEGWPRDMVVEVREIYFSMIWRTVIQGPRRIKVYTRQLWTQKSRREAQVFDANWGTPWPGHYTYDEVAHDDEIELSDHTDSSN